MKVVFRTYTKRDGSPEDGYWAVLQHLEGLKDKDILVRIDIDKKNQLGYDEVDVFCPSLKISHLELKQIEESKFEATFDTKNLRTVFQVLLYMGKAGNGGHSYELLIGDKSFYIDGDGNDHLESINGTPLHKIKEDNRYGWSDIYNKDLEEKEENMNAIKINEAQLRKIVENAVTNILKEDISDWLYAAHTPSRKEIPNPTVEDVIRQNGWIIKAQRPQQGGVLYQLEQKTGAFGNTEGTLTLDELIADIKEFGKFAKIMKRSPIFSDPLAQEAERAIIYVK